MLRMSGGSLVWYVAACAMCISLQQHFVLFDKVKIVYTLQTRPPSDRSKKNLTACCDAADLARRGVLLKAINICDAEDGSLPPSGTAAAAGGTAAQDAPRQSEDSQSQNISD